MYGVGESQECSCCKTIKPVSAYYLHSNGKPRKRCKTCHQSKGKEWRVENPPIYAPPKNELQRKQRLEASQRWRRNNLAYDAARAQQYRTRKINQMPSWADAEAIFKFYDECPPGYHVDHIIPLKGKIVRGFHVLNNLQYLPARENLSKRNRYVW